MAAPDVCPVCGTERQAGTCPRCHLHMGPDGPAPDPGHGAPAATLDFVPPPGLGGVLETIAAGVGPIPRVLLRDTDVGAEPPVARPETDQCAPSARLQIQGEIARGEGLDVGDLMRVWREARAVADFGREPAPPAPGPRP